MNARVKRAGFGISKQVKITGVGALARQPPLFITPLDLVVELSNFA